MELDGFIFVLSLTVLECFGIAILIMVGYWTGHYRGGFAWDGSAKEFNYHPLYMIISMVFLNSQAMIAYRVLRNDRKFAIKLLHMAIQAIAFGYGVTGLKAVFDFHNHKDINNLYSLHSWIGITTFVLFSCQLACGFLGFLYPKLPDGLRAIYLKVHVFFGICIFLMAIATCLTGITEKVEFTISATYSDLPPEGILVNILVVFLVIYGGLVFFFITNGKFKRTEGEETRSLLENEP